MLPIAIAIQLVWQNEDERGSDGRRSVPMPWFLLGFLALVRVNSAGLIPAALIEFLATLSTA